MANEFTSDGEYIFINTPYAEAYIPESLFANNDDDEPTATAYEYGNGFMAIGVFDMRFFTSDTQDREKVPVRTFNYPNIIETYPSASSIATLTINGRTDRYRVLKYYYGDTLMHASIKQSVTNCELFMRLVISGKISKALSYEDIYKSWKKNFEINGINMAVPAVTLQMVIAVVCHDKDDLNMEFRLKVGKGSVDPHGYVAMNINQISAMSSVMSALSFERFADKLASSINMTKSGAPQKKSPIEKVISY